MLVYLLRHGETDWNTEKRFQGREDIPLNAAGLRQAEESTALFRDIRLDYILTSPLSRAVVTAKFISDYTGVPVTVEPDLTERSFGSLSGMVYSGQDVFKLTENSAEVEPIESVTARMLGVIKKYPMDSSVLIVSHGGSINSILRLADNDSIRPGRAKLKNACLSCLDYDGEAFKVIFFNKTV
jgi:uncharacterized phosphatase